jgi:hypothetical protein
MKRIAFFLLAAFLLSSCNGWSVRPLPNNPTPFLPPSRTPSIYSPTPIGGGKATLTPVFITATNTPTFFPTITLVPTSTNTFTPTITPTVIALRIVILGCNTSIDVSHGMGEVTNAFVTLENIGNIVLTNLRATLYALDEGREHPDKTRVVPSIPVGYEVTIKLTVDSTYKAETPIQVEINSDQGPFPREGSDSCLDIGLFAPNPESLNTPVPSKP